MQKIISSLFFCVIVCFNLQAQKYNGIDANMGNLFRMSDAKTRSISPENFNGAKGEGGKATTGTGSGPSKELGQGWKVSPSVVIKSKTTFTVPRLSEPRANADCLDTPNTRAFHRCCNSGSRSAFPFCPFPADRWDQRWAWGRAELRPIGPGRTGRSREALPGCPDRQPGISR